MLKNQDDKMFTMLHLPAGAESLRQGYILPVMVCQSHIICFYQLITGLLIYYTLRF